MRCRVAADRVVDAHEVVGDETEQDTVVAGGANHVVLDDHVVVGRDRQVARVVAR